jgi:murein DD-endopeptidase MepM/ murein hydrolase activator NlpD
MFRWIPLLLLAFILIFLATRHWDNSNEPRGGSEPGSKASSAAGVNFDPAFTQLRPVQLVTVPYITRLSAALGSENGALTYNAQPFLTNRHLGDDINGIGGWNSDFGDPVYAIGNGLVTYSGIPSPGWGKSISLAHRTDPADPGAVTQSFYSHLSELFTAVGDVVGGGDHIGSVGNSDGRYLAHLHLEVRKGTTTDPGEGYNETALNRLDPTLFLESRQPPLKLSLQPGILSKLTTDHSLEEPITISEIKETATPSPAVH